MRKAAQKIITKALGKASRMNDLANTYDYNHGPPPAAIAPELEELKESLLRLWVKLTPREFEEYQRQYSALPNSPQALPH